MPIAFLLTILSANFAIAVETDSKDELGFSYGRVSYVKTKLPENFNADAFREKCLAFIKFMKKDTFDESLYETMDYYFFAPDKANVEKDEKVPLVVFLHGMAEGGKNVKVLFRHPQPLIFTAPENQKKYPCYFVAPQQYDRGIWMGSCGGSSIRNSRAMKSVLKIIRIMQKKFPDIDKERIYLTGLSSGGHGCCEALMKNPGVFAGIVPIAGVLIRPEKLKVKQKVGVWSFWNDNEQTGTRTYGIKTVKKFAAFGADARYTKFHPEIKPRFSRHFSWAWAYAEPDLIPWLFSHKRDKKAENKIKRMKN